MIEVIYLVRHGFRLSWETSLWNSPTKTPRDPPLALYGTQQANQTANHFHSLSLQPTRIYSSPLYRCLQTAHPIATKLQIPIRVEHGLGEWYLPVKRGLHPKSKSATELKQFFPSTIAPNLHQSLLIPPQTGETIKQIHQRAKEIITKLITQIEAEDEEVKIILICTHAATNIALGRALVGDEMMGLPIRSGCCSIGKYEREGEGWKQTLNGDSSHLEKGEERHWEFEYVEEYEEDGILEGATEEVPLSSDNYKIQKL